MELSNLKKPETMTNDEKLVWFRINFNNISKEVTKYRIKSTSEKVKYYKHFLSSNI